MDPEYRVYLQEKLNYEDLEDEAPCDPYHYLYGENEEYHNFIKRYDEEMEETLGDEEYTAY